MSLEQRTLGQTPQHKFKVGQLVNYSIKLGMPTSSSGYTIIRQLPPEDGHFLYRIKSAGETYERVAREQDLRQRQQL